MSSATEATTHATIVRQKPLMRMPQILLMNLGFFGIQYSFGMQQTAVNPIYNYLGANPHNLPILNLAGPVTGLLIQPLISSSSRHCATPASPADSSAPSPPRSCGAPPATCSSYGHVPTQPNSPRQRSRLRSDRGRDRREGYGHRWFRLRKTDAAMRL